MEAISEYLLRCVAAAILCAIIGTICDNSAYRAPVRMILGVAMLITLIQPVVDVRLTDVAFESIEITEQRDQLIEEASSNAQYAVDEIISGRINTYIMDKAAEFGTDIVVSTTVKDGVPAGVTITGNIAPYVRSQLSSWIVSQLGISKEAQYWS